MSLKSKIQALITAANAKTGETDATLTDAVQTLVDGYGQGADPVINPLSVTANGTYTAPSGVDGYSPVTVDVPQGITPTGNINITDTNVTDVTNYATAKVVDTNLVASNIKEGVNILGILGTFAGGGWLPSVINKIDDGSFTVAADTNAQDYNISHNLGETPKGFFIWSDLGYGEAESTIMLSSIGFSVNNFSETITGFYGMSRKLTTGVMNAIASGAVASTWLTTTTFKVNATSLSYKAGITYKWLVWA